MLARCPPLQGCPGCVVPVLGSMSTQGCPLGNQLHLNPSLDSAVTKQAVKFGAGRWHVLGSVACP